MAQVVSSRSLWFFTAVVALLAFIEGSLPYWYAASKSEAGHVFLGQVAYTPDQNMYWSFVSQARDGQFLLYNKLTAIPNPPIFVNLEWWLTGFIQRCTGISENAAYQVWRLIGTMLLCFGFASMARLVLSSFKRIKVATVVTLFTGGLGFVFAALSALHIIGFAATQNGIIDMRYGLLPFQQMLTNPHFAFPHGLILLAYSSYLIAEQRRSTRYYIYSGLLFTVIGLVRPYDIIPPFVIFPLNALLNRRGAPWQFGTLLKRVLPLFILLPVLAYNVRIFKTSEAFKGWATQGLNAGAMPNASWHFLAYGILGILAIIRISQQKRRPLSATERFLVLWFVVTFAFIQLGRYIPAIGWSPQIGVYLAVSLALLGFNADYAHILKTNARKNLAIAALVAVVLISNISIVLYFAKYFNDPTKKAIFYATRNEMDALQWLKEHAQKNQVVLALPTTSQRIAKYTSASVVAAHYSVTPHFATNAQVADDFFSRNVLGERERQIADSLHISWVFIGPAERALYKISAGHEGYFEPAYTNNEVVIYKVTK